MMNCDTERTEGRCGIVCEGYKRAHAAGRDAGNANMRHHARTEWNREDLAAAARYLADAFRCICPLEDRYENN